MTAHESIGRRTFLQLGLGTGAALAGPDLFAQQTEGPFSFLSGHQNVSVARQDELWRMGIADLARAIRDKQVSSREVIQAHLDRIATINGTVNAVTVVLDEEALRAAEEADRALARGTTVGPLHGVPMTIKENIDLAGSATTNGVIPFRENVVSEDSPQVAQLKRAGAIPIGRTNLPDMGLRWHTDNALRGATQNPWNRSLTPGGSSGGEAAALATGMTPLGLGNDYGGSLRYPAQCCGITSIRPSLGRVPSFVASQAISEQPMTLQLFAVQGPMARSVRDVRLALQSMSGPDARDPWWTPAPFRGRAVGEPIRVALSVDPGHQGVDPDVAKGVREAGRVLSDAGYAVEEIELPGVQEAAELWVQLIAAEIRTVSIGAIRDVASVDALTFLDQVFAPITEMDLPAYIRGLAQRNGIARQWSQFAERYPLIVGPVSTAQPFPVGRDIAGVEAVQDIRHSLRLVVSVNLLGLPSAAVPVGLARGIPQGVQIIGSMYREDLCLDAAETIERALGVLTPIDPKM